MAGRVLPGLRVRRVYFAVPARKTICFTFGCDVLPLYNLGKNNPTHARQTGFQTRKPGNQILLERRTSERNPGTRQTRENTAMTPAVRKDVA